MPVWGALPLALILQRDTPISDYVIHGEFALYSASIISGTAFLVFRDIRNKPFPCRLWFGLLCLVIAIVSTLVFAGVFAKDQGGSISVGSMAAVTLTLFAVTIIVAVLVMLFDLQITEVDPAADDRAKIDELGQKFRKRRKK